LAARAKQLSEWRKNNPEKFAACTEAAWKSSKRSRMEQWLKATLGWEMSKIRCGEFRKQVDFVKDHVWIEIDGPHHFKETWPVKWNRPWSIIQERDQMLKEEAISRKNITLIRAGMECFKSSNGAMKEEWFQVLTYMLGYPIPGIWCLGKLYESVPWANDKCMILKLPAQRTTLYCPQEL
jgi:hypothetical protein